MVIRKITDADLEEIALIHLNSFDEKHFSKTFSKELLIDYLSFLINNNEYSFLIEHQHEISGYLIGGTKSSVALKQFKKRNLIKIFIQILKNPSFIIEKMRETIFSLFTSEVHKTPMRLYLIAVTNNKKGMGIGKKLVNHFEEQLQIAGIFVYGLSVRKENERGINFYENTGYKKDTQDFKSIYFIKNLQSTQK